MWDREQMSRCFTNKEWSAGTSARLEGDVEDLETKVFKDFRKHKDIQQQVHDLIFMVWREFYLVYSSICSKNLTIAPHTFSATSGFL